MLTSPVLRYELLTLGRRRRYFLLRGIYVIGLLFALWLCYLEAVRWLGWAGDSLLSAYSRLAEYFFASFAGIQLGAILLLTPASVAGTIAGEHERRTIDYLLTTHLTDGEITLCKFAARMMSLIYQLLVGLPVLALVMLFGGIDPATLVKVFGYSALVLLGTASLSLWISASCRSTRVAITSAYLAMIVLGGAPIAYIAALEIGPNIRSGFFYDVAAVWNLWSPIFLIVGSFEGGVPSHRGWHRPEYIVPIYLTASVVWLGLAVRALRRTYAVGNVVNDRGRFWSRRAKAVSGKLVGRYVAPASQVPEQPYRRVGRHAMLWKETVCQRSALRLGWIGRAATFALFAGAYLALACAIVYTIEEERLAREVSDFISAGEPFGYIRAFRHTPLHSTSYVLNGTVGTFVLLLIAARAAGSVTSEKEQDSWPTLLSTPLSGAEIVWSKIAGAMYSVRYWYLLLIITWLCCGVRYPYQFAFLPALFAVHLLLGWLSAAVGLYFSLKFKSSLWSIGATVAVLAIVMGALPMLAGFFCNLSRLEGRPEDYAIGFIAPAAFFGSEYLFVAGISDHVNESDGRVALSICAAVVSYAIAAIALTNDLVRGFAGLTGRLDGGEDSDSDKVGKTDCREKHETETATEATT